MSHEQSQYLPTYPVIMEDDVLHTAANNYCCSDPTCPCSTSSDSQEPLLVGGSLTSSSQDEQTTRK